jgi:hypothetical protein
MVCQITGSLCGRPRQDRRLNGSRRCGVNFGGAHIGLGAIRLELATQQFAPDLDEGVLLESTRPCAEFAPKDDRVGSC